MDFNLESLVSLGEIGEIILVVFYIREYTSAAMHYMVVAIFISNA